MGFLKLSLTGSQRPTRIMGKLRMLKKSASLWEVQSMFLMVMLSSKIKL